MGHALGKRADVLFDETGLRLAKVLEQDRKSVALWRVEIPRGSAVNAVNSQPQRG